MTDVVLTQEELQALQAVHKAAVELVTGIPYITAAGGNITRQNILVQALSTALEAARTVDFEHVRELEAVNNAAPDRRRTRATQG